METTRHQSISRPALSKKEVLLTIELSVPSEKLESISESESGQGQDKRLDSALSAFEEHVADLGYTDFDVEFVETPYETNRGRLYAKGTFVGPSCFADKSRAPEDMSSYSFHVLEDPETGDFVIEVKHESAFIASFKITHNTVDLLDGELPEV
jgi:hypothetical protein